jgi:hypothetical protein
MRTDFLKFLKVIFIFSAIVAAANLVYSIMLSGQNVPNHSWLIFFYFILGTSVFHLGLLRSSMGKPQGFVRYYMGATTLKLMVHVVFILLFCLFNRDEAVRFIVTFLIFYLLYTVFEVAFAATKFRKN